MSLRVWMPLTGDLYNQGLSNITATNSNATVDATGKIGSCYKNTNTAQGVILNNFMPELKTYTNYSMCAWVYLTSNNPNGHSSAIISSGNWNSGNGCLCFGLYDYNEGYGRLLYPSKNTWAQSIALPNKIVINTWYHITITYNGSKTKAYINGEFVGEVSNGGICENSNTENVMIGSATYAAVFTLRGKYNDIRIYDHCLSPKEVKEIAQGLVVHYKLDSDDDVIYDCSGYGNDGTITGSLSTSSSTLRYSASTNFAAVGDYISRNTVTSECKTASIWCYVGSSKPSSNSVLFADYNSKLSLGFYSSGTQLITSCSGASFSCVDTTDIKLNSWNHLVLIHDGSTSKVYINGVLQTNRSNTNYWTHSTQTLMVASRSSGNGFIGQLSDFRMYATVLSEADIKELYDTAASIDDGGNLHDFECVEDEVDKAQVLKTGIVKTDNFIEFNDKLKALGDGSVFLQILHHNNPASNLFTINNCWLNNTTDLYSALLLLKDSSWFTSLSEYEFLICEKLTSTGTESQYRWKQTSNPSTSSTLSGYSVISGSPARPCGLMNKGTYAAMHNGASWWTACGSYSAYQGGIPGVAGVITTGYLDLYVRIPDEMIKGALSDFLKMYKKSIIGKQMIER